MNCSMENLRTFVDDLLADKTKRYLKSEPVPEAQSNVTIVVGDNFKDLIENADKDVFLLLHADEEFCAGCDELVPLYDKLGVRVSFALERKLMIHNSSLVARK